MSKSRILASVSVALMIVFICAFSAFAETTPTEIVTTPIQQPTQVTVPITDPTETNAPITDATTPTENGTDTTDNTLSTDVTDPSETQNISVPSTSIPPVSDPGESGVSSGSVVVNPNNTFTPSKQDYNKNDWNDIDQGNVEQIKLDNEQSGSKGGRFDAIQNSESLENEDITWLLILGIFAIAIALAGVTFIIIYKPKKVIAASVAKGTARKGAHYKSSRPKSSNSPSDYNDGF